MHDKRHLFRGERIDDLNKDWAIGHYVSVPRHMIVLTETVIGHNWYCFDIDPATIGRCTGLVAAKSYRGDSEDDRLVFEGDVVRGWDRVYSEHNRIGIGNEAQYIVEYGWTQSMYEMLLWPYLEIIGNIHDNPELLGGEETRIKNSSRAIMTGT